jgi:hypothetical protein
MFQRLASVSVQLGAAWDGLISIGDRLRGLRQPLRTEEPVVPHNEHIDPTATDLNLRQRLLGEQLDEHEENMLSIVTIDGEHKGITSPVATGSREPLPAEKSVEHEEKMNSIVTMDAGEPVSEKYEKLAEEAMKRSVPPLLENRTGIKLEKTMVIPLKWRAPASDCKDTKKIDEAQRLRPVRYDANELYLWLMMPNNSGFLPDNRMPCTKETMFEKLEFDEEWLPLFAAALEQVQGSNGERLTAKRFYEKYYGITEAQHLKLQQDARECNLGENVAASTPKLTILMLNFIATLPLLYFAGNYFSRYGNGDFSQKLYNRILKTYELSGIDTDQGFLNVSTTTACNWNISTTFNCKDLAFGISKKLIDIDAIFNINQSSINALQYKLIAENFIWLPIATSIFESLLLTYWLAKQTNTGVMNTVIAFSFMQVMTGLLNYMLNSLNKELVAEACVQGCNAFNYELTTTGATYSIDSSFSRPSSMSDLFKGLGLQLAAGLFVLFMIELKKENGIFARAVRFFKPAERDTLSISNYNKNFVGSDIVDDELMPEAAPAADAVAFRRV